MPRRKLGEHFHLGGSRMHRRRDEIQGALLQPPVRHEGLPPAVAQVFAGDKFRQFSDGQSCLHRWRQRIRMFTRSGPAGITRPRGFADNSRAAPTVCSASAWRRAARSAMVLPNLVSASCRDVRFSSRAPSRSSRRQAELDAAVVAIGDATGIRVDSSNMGELDTLFSRIRSEKGRIGVLMANAGRGFMLPLGSITEKQFDDTFGRNVKGVLFTVQKALPSLSDGASVILTGSTAASGGTGAFSVSAASKAAVRAFSRNWILDLIGPAHDHALGNLEFERDCVCHAGPDVFADHADQVVLVKLPHRQVDGDLHRPVELAGPGSGLAAGFLHYPCADLQDKAGRLRQRDELGRRHRAQAGAGPAQQCFEADGSSRTDVHLGLEHHVQFISFQCTPQMPLDAELPAEFAVAEV